MSFPARLSSRLFSHLIFTFYLQASACLSVLRITSELDEVNSIKKSLLESIDSLQAEIENHVIECVYTSLLSLTCIFPSDDVLLHV